jgi:hypothetical protein
MTPPARPPYDDRAPSPGTVAQPARTSTGSNLSVSTLGVAAISSAIAAYVTSKVWQGGTLISTAMTPVIVSIVKEFLDRPASKITEVSSRAVRRTPGYSPSTPSAERFDEPDGIVAQVHEPAPVPTRGAGQPTAQEPSRYRVYGTKRKRWRLAIVTGLLAFVVVAAVMTVPELVSGSSLFNSNGTTLWGGQTRHHSSTTTTTTTTTSTVTTPTTTPTQTVTVQTTTPTTTTPTTTVPTTAVPTTTTPTQTTPAPQGATTTPSG